MAKDKSVSPSWADVRASLLKFDRAGLQGLIQNLYAASKDNQAFLHARFGLGPDPLVPYKATISRWINPDLMKNQTVSVSKAKTAIADYDKAIGRPAGLAELSIFYCEEAFGFVESCSFGDERYFIALIRMYDRSVNCVLNLPLAKRSAYVKRLGKLRSRAKHVGWGVEDELNDRWHAAGFRRAAGMNTLHVSRPTLTELARAGRRLMGRAQTINLGADVFLADTTGRYLGRICHYRECNPRVLSRYTIAGKRTILTTIFIS